MADLNRYDEVNNPNVVINKKLRQYFDGKIVRKDLTKSIKEGANVPIYVLEFLLGQYCSSDDPDIIEEGVKTVKKILADNFVRPDEAQKVLSILREQGSYTVIDRITAKLNIKQDRYEAEFSNLGVKEILLAPDYVSKFDRLLCGGIWCIVQLEYEFSEEDRRAMPIRVRKLTPIQMPHIDLDEIKEARKEFTKEEWINILLRSTGMESDKFTEREKWLLLARMIPLVENNFNLCELGPRSTGKSHIYKEISPNSILVSGGQTTVANLFYNMANKTVGLVGLWDCVAFDEVAGITFKDKDGVQIMKDYMASGSFARGKEEKAASASMVFVGNINQSVDVLLKTSHLFEPFPEAMAYDTAFLDRMHCYVPGWEIPKYRPDFFTNEYGFITDYLSEIMREMRKEQFSDISDKYFRFGSNLNQRDVIGVRKMISGFAKLLYPNGEFTKEDIAEIVIISLELRRRVKEQLKKIGGMEFYDVNFSYID
ncbi:MAG: protease Lon-related BREX system protein BrxL, partial [Bacteroidales bacterium]